MNKSSGLCSECGKYRKVSTVYRNFELKVEHNEGDFSFDEIGSVLKIKELQDTKEELFKSLEMFYKVFYLGEEMEEETEE